MSETASVLERDDAFQVASLEAWRASLRYNPAKGVSESTWCVMRARRALLDENRKAARRRRITHIVSMDPARLAQVA